MAEKSSVIIPLSPQAGQEVYTLRVKSLGISQMKVILRQPEQQ